MVQSPSPGIASVYRLESPNPLVGGVLLKTPSGFTCAAYWQQSAPVTDTLELAKDCAARLLDHLIKKHNGQDSDRINWPSVVASCQYHIKEWNDKRRAALYSERDALNAAAGESDGGSIEGVGGGGGASLH